MGSACCLTVKGKKFQLNNSSDKTPETNQSENNKREKYARKPNLKNNEPNTVRLIILVTAPSKNENEARGGLNQRCSTTQPKAHKNNGNTSDEDGHIRPRRKTNTTIMNRVLAFHKELIIEPLNIMTTNSNFGKKITYNLGEDSNLITLSHTPIQDGRNDYPETSNSQINIY
jgi:hypothetical protein